MKFKAVKGTRDFYPDVMRLRNYIVDAWRRVSLRNGFEEYDAPIFEYLDLFTIKSGDEIAEQLFHFTDRGGRRLAIRPEITPSLARMVAAKINTLPRPIKWFSVPRLCRAENPQKGRLREFFQWNVDIIGVDGIQADVECIFTAVDFLREVKLTADDACVRIGCRPLTVASLEMAGMPEDKIEAALALLDKRPKVTAEVFIKLATAAGLDEKQLAAACALQDCKSIKEIQELMDGRENIAGILDDLRELMKRLEQMGIGDYCQLDMSIVRGLAYYTGVVYEVFDRKQSLRAVAGGGRYDKLLEIVGGPAASATGFGMGDVVLGILLDEKGKLPEDVLAGMLDFFVIDGEDGTFEKVLEVVAALRTRGYAADYSFKRQNIGKQMREANRRGARLAMIIKKEQQGDQPEEFTASLKNLLTGEQRDGISITDFLNQPTLIP
ncbi:MAG: histidine--tRNA ligase [Phycisphaerae bacterium]|nr:histidine--tRNA ligase [Phycisphaerae bacterium]